MFCSRKMLRFPVTRITSRADMYYASNIKLGAEDKPKVVPLFARTLHYEEINTGSRKYLEEDRTYIPLRTLSPIVFFEGLALICAPKSEIWTIKKEYVKTSYDGTLWDVDAGRQGTVELGERRPVDPDTGRADTAYCPRIPRIPRFVNFRDLPANICFRDGPLILGLHEAVIPIPRDMNPEFGIAREIFLLFPELKGAIIKDLGDTRVGDIVVCKVKTGFFSAHLYLPITRESTAQLPCFEPYDHMMKRILSEAQKRDATHLALLRAPGKPYAENWEQAARYYSRGFWNTPVVGLVLRGIQECEVADYPGNTFAKIDEDQECPGATKVTFRPDRN